MKKLTRGILVVGLLAGTAGAVIAYLKGPGAGEEVVQISFDDNTTKAFDSNSIEAQEFTDIARKLVDIGF